MKAVAKEDLRFDAAGLIPVVVQEASNRRVLMVAYANAAAIEMTVQTGEAHFYSRSRGSLWKKGETSGNTQRVIEIRVDCDEDTLLYIAEPAGPACHTGEASCFYRSLEGGAPRGGEPAGDVLERLTEVIAERCRQGDSKSYVRSLVEGGPSRIAEKVLEEAAEVEEALVTPLSDDHLVHEVADVWFHTLVGLGDRGLGAREVLAELGRRFGISGLAEKRRRKEGTEETK